MVWAGVIRDAVLRPEWLSSRSPVQSVRGAASMAGAVSTAADSGSVRTAGSSRRAAVSPISSADRLLE
ncbi:hypothetical protein D3C72_2406510 [compost metagenome]